jgi:hypothetical protein
MRGYGLTRLDSRRQLLWSLLYLTLVLMAYPLPVRAASSIFDDDWKPATLPANPIEPRKDQSGGSPKSTQTTPAKPVIIPREAKLTARHPVPEAAALAPTRKMFRELFQSDLSDGTTAGRHSLAVKLLDEGARCQDKPTDEYVLLAAAYQAGMDAQDLSLCLAAVDALCAAFEVDGSALKAKALLGSGLKGSSPAGWMGQLPRGDPCADWIDRCRRLCRRWQAGAPSSTGRHWRSFPQTGDCKMDQNAGIQPSQP